MLLAYRLCRHPRGTFVGQQELAADAKALCVKLVEPVLGPSDGTAAADWQIGETMIFMRQGKLELLDKAVQVSSM